MARVRNLAAWAGFAAAYAACQASSSLVTRQLAKQSSRRSYDRFEQPPYAPPGVTFPVVWTGLNATTATSAWRLWQTTPVDRETTSTRRKALAVWAAALAVRSTYTPLAFGERRLWSATVSAGVLCGLMTEYAVLARRVDPAAGMLALPEVVWTAFATVLSSDVARRNPQPSDR